MNRVVLIILVFFVDINIAYTQVSTSSPYSRFGLGDLQTIASSEYNALGGGVTGLNSSYSINPHNPATYTSFGPNSFLFSTGAIHKTVNMQSLSNNQTTNNTSFSHLKIGFPITSKIGASVGLLPFSNTGYEFSSIDQAANAELFDELFIGILWLVDVDCKVVTE